MNTDDTSLNQISERIIGCAFQVINTLGTGFLEKVYENALAHDLRKIGMTIVQQQAVAVHYDGIVVGNDTIDLLVEQKIIVELKTAKAIDNIHAAQCINYLKATNLPLCLLLNFAKPRLEIHRFTHGR